MAAPSATTGEPCCSERIAPAAKGVQAARCAASRKAAARLRVRTGWRAAGSTAWFTAKVAGAPALAVIFLFPGGTRFRFAPPDVAGPHGAARSRARCSLRS